MNLMEEMKKLLREKEAEVERYRALLEEYGRGRWYWSFHATLDKLEEQLKDLNNRMRDC